MPDHDPSSPWSRETYAEPYPQGYQPRPSVPPALAGPYGGVGPAAPASTYAGPPIEVHVAAPQTPGRGLAITGVVLGGLALLGVLVVGLLALLGFLGTFFDDEGGGGPYGSPRGTVAPAASGGLTGPALATAITTTMEDLGEEPGSVVCPATPKVAQDVTTVCHGTDYGTEATFVVFFEDAKGSYTVLEL